MHNNDSNNNNNNNNNNLFMHYLHELVAAPSVRVQKFKKKTIIAIS